MAVPSKLNELEEVPTRDDTVRAPAPFAPLPNGVRQMAAVADTQADVVQNPPLRRLVGVMSMFAKLRPWSVTLADPLVGIFQIGK